MESQMWTVACKADEVPVGAIKRVELPGLPAVAVYNIHGTFYVTADRCTHAEACLSDGTLDDDIIECPFHGGAFHVPTGKATSRPAKKPVQVFEVEVRDGNVVIAECE